MGGWESTGRRRLFFHRRSRASACEFVSHLAIYFESLSRANSGCGTARPGTRLRPSHTVSEDSQRYRTRFKGRTLGRLSNPLDSKQLLPAVLCSCVLLDCVRSPRAAGSTNHGSACAEIGDGDVDDRGKSVKSPKRGQRRCGCRSRRALHPSRDWRMQARLLDSRVQVDWSR